MESFVDLSYRGLSLGRRIKLTQVRPTTGYLETPAPMPVGSTISIATDDGHAIEAVVTLVHEQVAGSELPPGMKVKPQLAGEIAKWWLERASPEPAVEATPSRAKPVTVRPRSDTMIEATPSGATVAHPLDALPASITNPPPISTAPAMRPSDPLLASLAAASQTVAQGAQLDNGGRTVAMPAMVDPDEPTGAHAMPAARSTGEHAVVDDGKATTMMDAVDISALGLDVADSGAIPTATDEEPDLRQSSPGLPTGSGGTKKRKKRGR